MYENAEAVITGGLSRGARITLGVTTALCGAAMFLVAPPMSEPRALGFHAFSVFCFLIAAACFTSGRTRQFIGSVIGCAIFLIGAAYLAEQLLKGSLLSERRGDTSVAGASLFFFSIGLPGAAYAYRTRFGFRKAS